MDVAGSRAGSWYNGPLSKSQANPGLQHNGIGEKGSQEWHNYNIQHRHMTHRESRAAAHLHGGLNAWWALNPNR